jgi:acetylglutamate kinase
MRIVVKVGGAQLEDRGARADLARSLRRAHAAGHEIVLVHGGGNQIRELSRRLGIADSYYAGLRITDAATADIVLMVLAGLVNKELVAALHAEGVRAAGLCGADGATFSARKNKQHDVDLGYVGLVADLDRQLVEALLEQGFMPVIATTAPLARGESDASDHFYNINADLAVGPLARAFDAETLLFLSDVPGVLDAERKVIAHLTPEHCDALRDKGVIHGGMIPKVDAALAALAQNPRALIKIAPASGADAVLGALAPKTGTTFARSESHAPSSSREAMTT